jgi:hypothetical protein
MAEVLSWPVLRSRMAIVPITIGDRTVEAPGSPFHLTATPPNFGGRVNRLWKPLAGTDLPLTGALTAAISPLLIVNHYGLFATMMTSRPEILLEGSYDGRTWREYVFRYKPGPVARSLPWCIPHQPRLDWQMWFAAYGGAAANPWFERLVQRLLYGSPPVLALLAANPFPKQAPRYLRAELYDYRFADPETHARTGQWWVRRLEGLYLPPVSLEDFSRARPRPSVALPFGDPSARRD